MDTTETISVLEDALQTVILPKKATRMREYVRSALQRRLGPTERVAQLKEALLYVKGHIPGRAVGQHAKIAAALARVG